MRPSYCAQAFALLLATVALAAPALAQDDQEAVERAVLDYVEAIEQGNPDLIERGVHGELHKFGFYRQSPDADYKIYPMTFDQLRELAATYKKEGHVPDGAKHSIEILDVLDQTASVKLTAFWGIDYMHLAKYDGEWKVVQVLWQSHPPQ